MLQDYSPHAKALGNYCGHSAMEEAEEVEKRKESERNTEEELAAFRYQWQRELRLATSVGDAGEGFKGVDGDKSGGEEDSNSNTGPSQEKAADEPLSPVQDVEAKACELYWMGVAAEKSGDMNGAIAYYRQAVQLDPNVDIKASQTGPPNLHSDSEDSDSDCENDLLPDLTDRFCQLSLNVLCQPKRSTQGTHVSVLPTEVLKYIMRFVASSSCDMRAIEQISRVCRGFYLLAREPQLWQSACKKLWGSACVPGTYLTWRKMFIMKPHLHFNGVYISKTSYIRQGERSLDGFYKPYHTVTYYRYLRFFADGGVMYQTSPDEPAQVVSKLCHRHSSDVVLLGNYQVQDRTVLIDLVSAERQRGGGRGRMRRRQQQEVLTHERRFHMELLLNKRKNSDQLTWIEHYCSTLHIPTGQEQTTQFSINYMYTPFHFSRVKSFTLRSTGILQ